ncbi:MAG: hypothetical protein JSU86_12315 [Phycisphaerales bacterium]|nr:MAG: hypothetical protein JSU86_12315 [Phycisphaerales bacterium]
MKSAVPTLLGLPASIGPEKLMQSDMAVVAHSWSQLGGAVWLVHILNEAVLDRWFPPSRRTKSGTNRGVPFFRTEDGLTVCWRGRTVALSRAWGPDSLLYETMNLMAGEGGDVLERSTAYRELMAYLPVGYPALAYLARHETLSADAAKPSPWWPVLDRAVVGLYEGEGRINVAVRASLAAPHHKPKLARTAINRLLRLPQTTLFALATTIDFDQAYAAAAASPQRGVLGRYLTFLAAVAEAPDAPPGNRPHLGPHAIVAWGQDLRESGSTPQVAIMIECRDGRAVRDHTRHIADKMIQLVRAVDPAKIDNGLTIQESKHLSVPILHVPLKAYAERSELRLLRLLANTEPAWTVWNGWLIFALGRDHIERIVEAEFGLAPTLATVPDMRALDRRPGERSVLSIIRAGLATNVLDQWLAAHEAGSPSLLDPSWWARGSPSTPQRPPRLGIGMKIVQEPGVVSVARVYPDTAAEGRLRPGDRILGIGGHLLSLTSPNADLRKRWADSTVKPGPTLRVQRGGTAIDVVLPKKEDIRVTHLRINPADAVRELASLGRTLSFASFAVNVTDERHYSARLSLRFSPAQTSNTSEDR